LEFYELIMMRSFKRPPPLEFMETWNYRPAGRDHAITRSMSASSPSDSVPVKNTFIDFPSGGGDSGDENEILPMDSAPACIGAQRNLTMFKRTVQAGTPSCMNGNELPDVTYTLSPQTAYAHGFRSNPDFNQHHIRHRRMFSESQHPEEETSSTTAADALPNSQESTTTMMHDSKNDNCLFTENSILTARTDYEWKPYTEMIEERDDMSELDDFSLYPQHSGDHNEIPLDGSTTKKKKLQTLDPHQSWLCDEDCRGGSSQHSKENNDNKIGRHRRKNSWGGTEDEPSTQDETTGDPGRQLNEPYEETSEKVEMGDDHHFTRTHYSEECSDDSDDSEGDSDEDSQLLGELPSIGSKNHRDGTCKRCCFFPKDRCTNGYDCQFCHYDHDKRKRKNKKKKKRTGSDGYPLLTTRHLSQLGKMDGPLTRNPTLDHKSSQGSIHDTLIVRELSRGSIFDSRYSSLRTTTGDRLKTIGRGVEPTRRMEEMPRRFSTPSTTTEIPKKEPILGKSIEKRPTPVTSPIITPSFLELKPGRERWGDMIEDCPCPSPLPLSPPPISIKGDTFKSTSFDNSKLTDEAHKVKKVNDWKDYNTPRTQGERYEEWHEGKDYNTTGEYNSEEWTNIGGQLNRLRPLPPIDWHNDDFTTPGYSDYSKDYKAPAHVWSPSRWDQLHRQQAQNSNYQAQPDYSATPSTYF